MIESITFILQPFKEVHVLNLIRQFILLEKDFTFQNIPLTFRALRKLIEEKILRAVPNHVINGLLSKLFERDKVTQQLEINPDYLAEFKHDQKDKEVLAQGLGEVFWALEAWAKLGPYSDLSLSTDSDLNKVFIEKLVGQLPFICEVCDTTTIIRIFSGLARLSKIANLITNLEQSTIKQFNKKLNNNLQETENNQTFTNFEQLTVQPDKQLGGNLPKQIRQTRRVSDYLAQVDILVKNDRIKKIDSESLIPLVTQFYKNIDEADASDVTALFHALCQFVEKEAIEDVRIETEMIEKSASRLLLCKHEPSDLYRFLRSCGSLTLISGISANSIPMKDVISRVLQQDIPKDQVKNVLLGLGLLGLKIEDRKGKNKKYEKDNISFKFYQLIEANKPKLPVETKTIKEAYASVYECRPKKVHKKKTVFYGGFYFALKIKIKDKNRGKFDTLFHEFDTDMEESKRDKEKKTFKKWMMKKRFNKTVVFSFIGGARTATKENFIKDITHKDNLLNNKPSLGKNNSKKSSDLKTKKEREEFKELSKVFNVQSVKDLKEKKAKRKKAREEARQERRNKPREEEKKEAKSHQYKYEQDVNREKRGSNSEYKEVRDKLGIAVEKDRDIRPKDYKRRAEHDLNQYNYKNTGPKKLHAFFTPKDPQTNAEGVCFSESDFPPLPNFSQPCSLK